MFTKWKTTEIQSHNGRLRSVHSLPPWWVRTLNGKRPTNDREPLALVRRIIGDKPLESYSKKDSNTAWRHFQYLGFYKERPTMAQLCQRHRWVDPYYRIKHGRIESVRGHYWPRLPSGVIRSDHNMKGRNR